jgi:hypothetical protein
MIEQDRENAHHIVVHTLCLVWFAMIAVTSLPLFVTILFRGMPGLWKNHHH